jgi:hypothetical protein
MNDMAGTHRRAGADELVLGAGPDDGLGARARQRPG